MLRRGVLLALAATLAWAPAASADVSVVSVGGQNVVRGVSTPGSQLIAGLSQSGGAITFGANVFSLSGLAPGAGCPLGVGTITCAPAITRVELRSGPQPDLIRVLNLTIPVEWFAGDEFDTANIDPSSATGPQLLHGEGGFDQLTGGFGDDLLDGGPGDDDLFLTRGADELIGGAGADDVIPDEAGVSMRVSLDDVANDALGGALGANVHSDVEDIIGGSAADTLVGSAVSNDIVGSGGNDVIDGAGGFDTVDGGAGDDSIMARDGFAELVACGDGDDTVVMDDNDVAVGCEHVTADDQGRPDADGDGTRKPVDCDDTNAAIRPGAPEVLDNGIDDNCDGADAVNLDRDGDGVPRPQDCDDNVAAVRPGAAETLGDRIDENCDGRAEPFPTLAAALRQATGANSAGTRFVVLRLSGLERGQRIRVSCEGRGCPFRARTYSAPRRGGRLDLRRRAFGDRRIRAGGKVTVRVTNAQQIVKQFSFEMRPGAGPIYLIRCASPPDGRLRRC